MYSWLDMCRDALAGSNLMDKLKVFLKTLVTPGRFMDFWVKDRWDTPEKPAADTAVEPYFYDRSGALKLNTKNTDVRNAFARNVAILSTGKNKSQK